MVTVVGVDGADEGIEIFYFWQPQYLINLVVDSEIELAFLIEEHFICTLNGIKILALRIIYELV